MRYPRTPSRFYRPGRRWLVTLLGLMLAIAMSVPAVAAPVSVPVGSAAVPEPPEVSAEAWILYDAAYGLVLAESNADDVRSIASTTKMMTALIAIEQGNLDDEVRISARAADVGESEVGLEAGEILDLRQLVTALMVRSGNDAAIAVAEHLGGTVEGFVELMNAKAVELGMENTSFSNPHGLDAPGHHSSARDLLTLARAGMDDPLFAELARTRRAVLPEDSAGKVRIVTATNRLLTTYEGAIGIKTGFTTQAGLTLVAAARRGDRTLYAIVLGSTDHFGDARALLDHGFDDYRLYSAIAAGVQYGIRRDPGGEGTPAVATEEVEVVGEPDAVLTVLPELREGLPILVARLDGEEIGTTAVHTSPAPGLPTLVDAWRWIIDLRFRP